MRKSAFTPEQILQALRQAEIGTTVVDICRKFGVKKTTFCRWLEYYAGVDRHGKRSHVRGIRGISTVRKGPLRLRGIGRSQSPVALLSWRRTGALTEDRLKTKMGRVAIVAIITLVFVLFSRSVDWRAMARVIASARPGFVLVCTIATLACIGIKGVRFWVLLGSPGTVRVRDVVIASFAGSGVNTLVVANAGEVARITALARVTKAAPSRLVGILAVDKMSDAIGFAILLLVAVAIVPLPAAAFPRTALVTGAGVVMLSVLIFALFGPRPPTAILARAENAGSLRGLVSAAHTSLHTARSQLRSWSFVVALGLTMVAWAGQVVTYAIAASAVYVRVPLIATVAGLVAATTAGIIRTTPGNVGVFEITYAIGVAPFGIPRTQAIAVAVLIQAIQMLSALGAGAVCLPWVARLGKQAT